MLKKLFQAIKGDEYEGNKSNQKRTQKKSRIAVQKQVVCKQESC